MAAMLAKLTHIAASVPLGDGAGAIAQPPVLGVLGAVGVAHAVLESVLSLPYWSVAATATRYARPGSRPGMRMSVAIAGCSAQRNGVSGAGAPAGAPHSVASQ